MDLLIELNVSKIRKKLYNILCWMRWHAVNGFPVYPGWQIHMGACLTVVHVENVPQAPGHGSTHLSFWQARLPGHSSLMVHSGRQFGARPMYPGKQEHAGVFPITRHCAFGPHGEGLHGFPDGSGGAFGSKQYKNGLKNCSVGGDRNLINRNNAYFLVVDSGGMDHR